MDEKVLFKIAKILIEVAENKGTITYEKLSQKINGVLSAIQVSEPIGELSKISNSLNLPLISVLVVSKKSDPPCPSEGYFKLCSNLKNISIKEAMNNFIREQELCYDCTDWMRLIEYLQHKNPKSSINKENDRLDEMTGNNKWLVVHDIEAYNENSRMLGFDNSIHNIKNISPGDKIAYYMLGSSTIKGIYEVCTKPWGIETKWSSENQIKIKPIIELKKYIDFKAIVPLLNLFRNKSKWQASIWGRNSIRKLSQDDFKIIEDYVYRACIIEKESPYQNLLEDDSDLLNETEERLIHRIKRYQQIVVRLKEKYSNCCQIEGCNFTFKKQNGECYSEAHHLELLSQGGSQEESNVVILCANHHRMFHYAKIKMSNKIGNKRKVLINDQTHYLIY